MAKIGGEAGAWTSFQGRASPEIPVPKEDLGTGGTDDGGVNQEVFAHTLHALHIPGADGQAPESLAGGGEDGVGHGRGYGGDAGLADAAHAVGAGDDMDLHDRHVFNPQHGVIVEVAFAARGRAGRVIHHTGRR